MSTRETITALQAQMHGVCEIERMMRDGLSARSISLHHGDGGLQRAYETWLDLKGYDAARPAHS